MTRLKTFSAALLAGSAILWTLPAFAQTAAADATATDASTTDVGTIDVQGAGQTLGSGYMVLEDGAKDRSTVTHEGVENLSPTVNPFQMISILPGVNQQSDDSLGLAGGTIRVRGLVANQMGFTINGAPFNDSGTFNVYPAEIIDSENVRQIWVTQGSADIDAPHAGASGGNIGVVTRAPLDNFNIKLEESGGYLNESREFVALDTGWIGDFKGFASYSYTNADKWRGLGIDARRHSDGNVLWQVTPASSVGLTWVLNDAINAYYRDYASTGSYNVTTPGHTALQTFNTIGRNADYDTFWGSGAYPIYLYGPNSTANCATSHGPNCTVANPNFPATGTSNVSNYYGLNQNPYRNGVITVPVHLQLTDNLRWDTNGYLWLGAGGAVFGNNIQEGSVLYGRTVAPAYGNAPGSTNEILTTEDYVNKTTRPGVTTKVTYDMDNFTFMLGGWMEESRLNYYQAYSTANADGTPCDRWLTDLTNNGCLVRDNTGAPIYGGPAYVAVSRGESLYFEGTGRFLDDALKVTVGLADRQLIRSVHNRLPICADDPNLAVNPGTAFTCASYATSAAFLNSAAYQYFNGPGVGAAAAYAAMRQFGQHPVKTYHEWLPEFNASYDLDDTQQVFAGLSTGFKAPSVANLAQFGSYTTAPTSTSASGNIMKITGVKPEYAYSWEAGYRYHEGLIVASATGYWHDLRNYQATVQVDPGDYITSNIGNVDIYGIDLEVGTRPIDGFTLYFSGEVQNSRLGSNLPADYFTVSGTNVLQYIATRGKQLVDTPNYIVSASIGYANDGFFGDITPHCQGQRATALVNDEWIPANCTVNASVGYHFGDLAGGALKHATFQIYASNLFDSKYLGQVYTQGQTNAKPTQALNAQGAPITGAAATAGAESYSAEPGAPFFLGAKFSVDVGN